MNKNDNVNLNKIKLFALDLDGTFYLGNQILDGSLDFLTKVTQSGAEFVFFTNNSSKAKSDYVKKLHQMNCDITQQKIWTSGDVAIHWIKKHYEHAKVFLLGTQELKKSFLLADITLEENYPDVVVVGFDMTLTYDKLEKACSFIRSGVPFFATHMDINCPTETGFIPDCGAICGAIELSTGVVPKYFGKPTEHTFELLQSLTGYSKEEIAFVGDRLYTDVAAGVNNGGVGILVLTGETKIGDIEHSTVKPNYVFASLKELGEQLH